MVNLSIHKELPAVFRGMTACVRGAAMFEFAITLPILLLLFAGGWEFARALWTYDMLNKGVRDASRYLAHLPDPTTAAAETMALYLVLTGSPTPGQPPRLDYNKVTINVGTRVYNNSGGNYRGPDGGTADIEVVQVRADYTFNAPMLGFLKIANPLTLSVAHEERHLVD